MTGVASDKVLVSIKRRKTEPACQRQARARSLPARHDMAWDHAWEIAGRLVIGDFKGHPLLDQRYEYNYADDGSETAELKKAKPEAVVIGGNIFYITWP